MIEHSVKNILESSIDELIIIIGHQSELIKNILSRHKKIKFIFNNKYKTGMASSIQIGLNNLSKSLKPDLCAWNKVSKIANKTFVPESDESRKKGAGGGNDND